MANRRVQNAASTGTPIFMDVQLWGDEPDGRRR